MQDNIRTLTKFTPEIVDLFERRYNIMRTISNLQPLGRRHIAEHLGLGERIVRGELNFLKEQQLIVSKSSGVTLTQDGEELLLPLMQVLLQLRGLKALERQIAQKTGLEEVWIVPGDLDRDNSVLQELGRSAGRYIRNVVQDDWVIAVTGGTTMAEVAGKLPPTDRSKRLLVVPARGGLGEKVEIQANTIAAEIARRLGAKYRLLHVPEGISEEMLDRLMLEHRVQEVVTLSRHANLLVHGIGNPDETFKRRELDAVDLFRGCTRIPKGEVFGNFFAADGQVLKTIPTVGPTLEELAALDKVVAVAGGSKKAEAILAVLRHGFVDVLITDQGAAESIRSHMMKGAGLE